MIETIKQMLGTVQCNGCHAKYDAVRDGGLGLAITVVELNGGVIRAEIGCGICSHTGHRMFSKSMLETWNG